MAAVVWLLLAVIWGTTWAAVRVGLDALPPFSFAGIRFLISGGVLIAVMLVWRGARGAGGPGGAGEGRGKRMPRGLAAWRLIVVTGFLAFVVTYATQFWGQQFVPSGLAAVLFATTPLWTMVFAHFGVPGETMTVRRTLGVLFGVGGVAVIFGDQLSIADARAVWACAAFLLGSLSMAGAQVMVKRNTRVVAPVPLAAFQMLLGGVLLAGMGVMVEGNPRDIVWSGPAVSALLYLALVGSSLAFMLFYWLLARMEVTKVSAMMLVHPAVAVLLGWLFLGETMNWRVYAGSGGILAGLGLVLGLPLRRVARAIHPLAGTRELLARSRRTLRLARYGAKSL